MIDRRRMVCTQDQHDAVAESAVVGFPHDIKGEGIYAYVTLKNEHKADAALEAELKALVRQKIAAYALPDFIQVPSQGEFSFIMAWDAPSKDENWFSEITSVSVTTPIAILYRTTLLLWVSENR